MTENPYNQAAGSFAEIILLNSFSVFRYPLFRFLWYVAPQLSTTIPGLMEYLNDHELIIWAEGLNLWFCAGEVVKGRCSDFIQLTRDGNVFMPPPFFTVSPIMSQEAIDLVQNGSDRLP